VPGWAASVGIVDRGTERAASHVSACAKSDYACVKRFSLTVYFYSFTQIHVIPRTLLSAQRNVPNTHTVIFVHAYRRIDVIPIR